MNDVRLYLDGELVTVDPNTIITETKQINNLFELQDRQTDYTNFFTVLLDNDTSNILDRLGDTYNTSIKPYRSLSPTLYRGGTPTIVNGKFIIDNVTERKKIKGSIQSGNISIYDLMGDLTVSDLDLSSLTHDIGSVSAISSFGNTWEDGYIYAISNFGNIDTSNVDFLYQEPSIYLKWIFEQIFIQNGFSYDYVGDLNPLESEHFKTRILTTERGFAYDDSSSVPESVLIMDSAVNLQPNSTQFIPFITTLDTLGMQVPFLSNANIIQFKQNAYYNANLTGVLPVDAKLTISVDYVKIGEITNAGAFDVDLSGYFLDGQFFTFVIESSEDTNFSLNVDLEINASANQINFSNYFTDLKLKDVFKMVLQMYCLLPQRVKNENKYEFITINDMFGDRESAQDLSSKYNNDRLLKESYRFGNYGRRNIIKYTYENEDDTYANGLFTIDDEILKDESIMFTVPFKAPEKGVNTYENLTLYDTLVYEIDTNDDGSIKEVKPITSFPYIGSVTKKNTTLNYQFSIDNTTGIYTGEVPFFDFNNQSFSYLIGNYYSALVATLNRTKVYDVELELTSFDVANFDFLKLVYLRQEQKYFYCNKIMNFRNNKVTKVQLIEVNTSLQTYGEYSDDYSFDYNI